MSLFLSIPATLALLISSEEITSALFGYGSFDILSVNNSARALFYFALGLPAYSLIKIFSSFLFARHNTKTPFYFSLFSVLLNILISVYFFKDLGFIIIPIATTVSSWFNTIILVIYIYRNNLFELNKDFSNKFLRIIFTNIIVLYFYFKLINFFENYLAFDSQYKLLTIIFIVLLVFVIYLLVSVLTKAFKISDIKIKY